MQYVFGDYSLDMQRYELQRARDVVPLDRQGFAVLAYLIEHRDRVVLRQELFDRLWTDRFVSDAALERCIAVIRRAVGDSGQRQRVIRTVHGRGYRFIAPLTVAPSAAEPCADPVPAPSLPQSVPETVEPSPRRTGRRRRVSSARGTPHAHGPREHTAYACATEWYRHLPVQ
jgi:DNA-binding winged helix-turn-helix (wHTH) protein